MLVRSLAAVTVLACTGSLLLAGGTSSATAPTRVVYGPVAVGSPSPLVELRGPLLPRRPAPLLAPMGPAVVHPEVGPPAVVGPGSPPHRVRVVQRLLNRAGAGVRVDGSWGPATTRAVEAVQRRSRLPVTGLADAMTVAALTR